MEELKAITEIVEPDERQRLFVMFDQSTGNQRPLELSDIYNRAAHVALHDGVPVTIRSHFATAQNLLAYSWFCYPFNVVAELHGYISVEFALRARFPDQPRANFKDLLDRAVREGLLRAEGFTYGRNPERVLYPPEMRAPPEIPDVRDYVRDVADAMRTLRNSLAHGSSTLHMEGGTALLVCSEIINQLFPRASDA
ncbi:MAG: hypothetical protein PHS32_08830 [Rhodoferax sp.]|uniref:hypothetical protein n=1 Tax=Rhodoferax sp. TaxID=50421 RepID=UPI0026376842|nr:hypothetical protein [Rhodoferax sp.]MDD5333839.1 hypothetical protein [Rhodoferax sp.]